jgi:hypothetical protein
MSAELTPRQSERKPVKLAAQCRTRSGLRDKGLISDISAEGCCVSTDSLFFRVGTRVVIRPEGMEGLSGIVRWISGDKAGVEFDNPLYGPVIDHLAAHFSAGKSVDIATC